MEEVEAIFVYESIEERLKCKKNEYMLDIMERFADLYDKNAEDLLFLINGKKVENDFTFEEMTKGDYQSRIVAIDDENTKIKIDEITITYSIEKEKNYFLRIFGDKFVDNNKNNCKIIFKE